MMSEICMTITITVTIHTCCSIVRRKKDGGGRSTTHKGLRLCTITTRNTLTCIHTMHIVCNMAVSMGSYTVCVVFLFVFVCVCACAAGCFVASGRRRRRGAAAHWEERKGQKEVEREGGRRKKRRGKINAQSNREQYTLFVCAPFLPFHCTLFNAGRRRKAKRNQQEGGRRGDTKKEQDKEAGR